MKYLLILAFLLFAAPIKAQAAAPVCATGIYYLLSVASNPGFPPQCFSLTGLQAESTYGCGGWCAADYAWCTPDTAGTHYCISKADAALGLANGNYAAVNYGWSGQIYSMDPDPLHTYGGLGVYIPFAAVVGPAITGIAGAVDLNQAFEDVRYVGVGLIALSLIVISFILVRKHLDAVGSDPDSPEYWAENERQAANAEGIGGGGYSVFGMSSESPEEERARGEFELKRANDRGMSLVDWKQEQADYAEADRKYFSDPEAREAAGLDDIAGPQADRAYVAALQNAPKTTWTDSGEVVKWEKDIT